MKDAFLKIGNELQISKFIDANSISETELFSKDLEEVDSMERVEGVLQRHWTKLAHSPFPSCRGFWQRKMRSLSPKATAKDEEITADTTMIATSNITITSNDQQQTTKMQIDTTVEAQQIKYNDLKRNCRSCR